MRLLLGFNFASIYPKPVIKTLTENLPLRTMSQIKDGTSVKSGKNGLERRLDREVNSS